MNLKNNENKILAAIILVALALRLAAILFYGDFWDDEMFSVVYSQKPWLDSIHFWLWETNPPLHMLFLKLWFYILPATEFWARIPSLIFGVISVWLVFKLTNKICGKRPAFLAALFFALLPYHIYISATARVYSLLVFLALCSMYYFHKIFIEEKYYKKEIFAYGAITLLLLFSHLTAGLLFICQLIILLAIKKPVRLWWKINFIAGAAAALWLIPSFAYKMTPAVATTSWFLQLSLGLEQLIISVFLLIGGPSVFAICVIGFNLFIILALAYLWHVKKEPADAGGRIMIFCWTIFPIIIPLFLGFRHIKFFLLAMPGAIMLIAESLNRLFPGKKIVLPYLILIIYCGYTLIAARNILPITTWKPTCDFIKSRGDNPEKSVFIYNSPFLKNQIDKYCPGIPMPQISYYLHPSDWDYDYITRNYIFYAHSPEEVQQWLKDNRIDNYQNIVLLQDEYEHMPHISAGLKELGWKLLTAQKATIMNQYMLYYYVHNPTTTTAVSK